MSRRSGVHSVVIICCVAVLIGSVIPESSEQLLSSDFDPLITQKHSSQEQLLSSDFDPLITQNHPLGAIRPYEFYKISVRWPKSECYGSSCVVPSYFTLHGLWPHYKTDTMVQPYDTDNSCTKVQPSPDTSITAASLAPILSNMNLYWPSLTNPTITENLNFWHHEWNAHGKCWDKPKQPNAYFQQALNFVLQNDLLNILKKAEIVPDDVKTYRRDDIAKAIKDSLGKVPEINCDNTGKLLREIRVCYDPKRRIDCPTPFSNNCASSLLFPKA